MKLSRRNALQVIAGTGAAAVFPNVIEGAAPAAPPAPPAAPPGGGRGRGGRGGPPEQPPAHARPIPPAPVHIEPPAGFGVAKGPYEPTWESLSNYQVPDWYRDAKFGIWAHWGPQCQPEMGDWYAQRMYQPSNPVYRWHVEKYGHPSKFGFKDVINEWKADKFDPEGLIALYKRAGAKFFAAMANHHDNLDMYDSTYQPWNTVRVGPKKDIVGMWAKAARAAGMRFAVTCHGDRSWSWSQDSQRADQEGPLAGVQYDGTMTREMGKGLWWEGLDPQDLYAQYHPLGRYNWQQSGEPPIDKNFAEKFFNRTIDLLNKYDPDLLYFDDTVLPIYPATDIGLRIAAYFYNNILAKRGKMEAILATKGLNATQRKAMVLDIERGGAAGLEALPWQTDTCIGSWHYERRVYEQKRYKSSLQVVQMLIDIVSKNGQLQLSVPQRGDGTIDDEEVKILEGIATWIAPNGEGIYSTRPWKVYGEGPSVTTAPARGRFGGAADVRAYTPEDIRFTAKGDTVFAYLMGWPTTGKSVIKSMATGSELYPKKVAKVELLGTGDVKFTQDAAGLSVQLPDSKPNEYAYCLKVTPA